MKKLKILLSLLLVVLMLAACTDAEEESSSSGTSQPRRLTLEERKDIFASYFNHNISYKTGSYYDDGRFVCDNGEEFLFSSCGLEDIGFIHPMTGSLDSGVPRIDGEKLIIFYVKGNDGRNYAKTISPVTHSDRYDRTPNAEGVTRFEGYDNAAEYFRSLPAQIRENLENVEKPKVLTIDEAMQAYWSHIGSDENNYLKKVGKDGEVYYVSKETDVKVMPTTYLVSTNTADTENLSTINNTDYYRFVIIQSDGNMYFVYLDGTVIQQESVAGVYKSYTTA